MSVCFADLVGFTQHSSVMAADELVALLDQIFSAFDQVAGAEGVEKIKTIGDAYMVAGGLPDPRPDHLEAVARTALAMRDVLAAIAQRTGQDWLALRIGIDSGPAVAGVIGRRRFIYDLWGDTVNTASRMESHGLPGEIQVTQRVAAALGSAYAVTARAGGGLRLPANEFPWRQDLGRRPRDPRPPRRAPRPARRSLPVPLLVVDEVG